MNTFLTFYDHEPYIFERGEQSNGDIPVSLPIDRGG